MESASLTPEELAALLAIRERERRLTDFFIAQARQRQAALREPTFAELDARLTAESEAED